MKLKLCGLARSWLGWLIIAGILLFVATPAWAHTVASCSVNVSADKVNVCVGELVHITVTPSSCCDNTTRNFTVTYAAIGTNTVSTNICGTTGSIKIYVSAITNLSPSAVTMCRGSFMTFTALANPANALCTPTWEVVPPNAGTLTVSGRTATLSLSTNCPSSTATLYAYCGTTTKSAAITVIDTTMGISSQPVSQVGCLGQSASFTVTATGNSLTYQWRKDGVKLKDNYSVSGSTTPTLTISNSGQSVCKSLLASNIYGVSFFCVTNGQTYAYEASGCATWTNGGFSDPDGNTYSTDCATKTGGPTVAPSNSRCPGLAMYSLVGTVYPNSIQFGRSGTFQAPATELLYLYFNDIIYRNGQWSTNSYSDNSGSWSVCVTPAFAGQYDVIVTSDCGSMISTAATLALSTACDGIPDWWRAQHFGGSGTTTNSISCTTCNPDGDCLNNLQEYQHGTDPNTSNSYSTATVSGGGTICGGQSATIQAVLTGTGPWTVTWSDGTNQIAASSPAVRSVTPTSTTIYAVTAVSNACGNGISSGSAIVTVIALPSADIIAPNEVCAGSTTNTARLSPVPPLHSFSYGADGSSPSAGLVQGSDGNFYGTTSAGGTSGRGTVFKITPNGAFTNLYRFSGADGQCPSAGLIQGSDGNFYGTTYSGGASGSGTVFKITPGGALTNLYSFSGADGGHPYAGLVQGSDGNFYGTTYNGGTSHGGTVFKITPGGALTTLYGFTGGADGSGPYAGLVQGSDGNFYGTTSSGGTSHGGTVFRITPGGALTTLHSFTPTDEGIHPGADGCYPEAALVQGNDGNFYGTTIYGGTTEYGGTVFKITPGGALTTLHSFSWSDGSRPGADGCCPRAGLIQGSDGNFYGTTLEGGTTEDGGTVFKITPGGALTTLHSFSGGADGNFPYALVQGADDNFYGITQSGGMYLAGTVFKIYNLRTYSWSITNGTITAGQGTRDIIWTVGSADPATLCVTVSYTNICAASSACAAVTVTMGTPSYLTATCSANFIMVSWGTTCAVAPSVSTGFVIKRSTTQGGPYTVIGTAGSNDRFYVDTTVVPGVTYYYVVTLQSSAGESPPSNEAASSTCAVVYECSTPSYEPDYWHVNPIGACNNCYNYANNVRTDTYAQPGYASGTWCTNSDAYCLSAATVYQYALNDGLLPSSKDAACPNGMTKVALFIWPSFDYHWYRQDANGLWTQKMDSEPATNLDNSDNIITDPETADRGGYTDLAGYLCTCSDSVQGQGHATIGGPETNCASGY
jgi:uncharacterized repeat protein (TIGR03803 family)